MSENSPYCGSEPCPVLLSSSCVFYKGQDLIYIGVNTNDPLQTVIEKINQAFQNSGVGYAFTNGIVQPTPFDPVQLGGSLIQNTTIGGNYTLTFIGELQAAKHITTGGTASQFVKGDGSLDSTSYQPVGNYLTALSGDGTASGPGSAVFTLTTVNFAPGTFGSGSNVPVVTVDAKGRVTNLTSTPLVVPPQSLTFIGDVVGSGLTGTAVTLSLQNINANVYNTDTALKFSVNSKGLVTSATPLTGTDIDSIVGYTVGNLLSTGSYANPSWITSLAWSKIISSPTTLSGYGITDALDTSIISQVKLGGLTALNFIKSGGTSVQFLKADGSVDSTAYSPINNPVFTGSVTLPGSPMNPLEAATKQYVDDVSQGLDIHAPCVAATTTNLVATYLNGVSGLGATLTNNGAQAALVIDGVTLLLNNRVLVKNQSSQLQNGIYTVTNVGSGSTNWVLTRATDYDQTAEINGDDFVFISSGLTNNNTGWVQTQTSVVIGVSNILFVQFSGAGTYQAGNGLTLSGNIFSINTAVTVDLNTAQVLTNKTITGSFTGNLSGNASTVTNGVYTTGSYSDPTWITGLAWSKILSTPTTLSGYGITDAYTQTQVNTLLSGYQPLLTNPVTGTGTSGQVSFWNGTTSQTGDIEFRWDNSTKRLLVGNPVIAGKFSLVGSTIMQSRTDAFQNGFIQIRQNASDILDAGMVLESSKNGTVNVRIDLGLDSISLRTNILGSAAIERWNITNAGVLLASGAQSIRTTTGLLSFQNLGGNVAIGTTTDAGFRLDVNGTARVQGNTTVTGNLTVNTNTLFVDSSNNRVGIGITTPSHLLSVHSTTVGTNTVTQKISANYDSSVANRTVQLVLGGAEALIGSKEFRVDVSSTLDFFNNPTFAIYRGDNANKNTFFISTLGNIGVNNSSPSFNLDVSGTTRLNGLQTFQGTTASDTAPLGSELATTGSGTNWTGTGFATGYTHTVGSTTSLTTSIPAVNGTYYQIAYTITGRTAGSITINYGGTSTASITATGATGPLSTSTANLEIVPTTDFDGTVVLSVRSISTSSATATFTDSGGNSRIQIRATSATGNTLVGNLAGRRITTGINNSFFGLNSGLNTTTGTSNSFFGLTAGQNNTTGSSNSFFGVDTGLNNTTGTSNSFFGLQAGLNNTTGSSNSFFGLQAGANNTTGSNNLSFGRSAGRFISSGGNLTIANNSIFLGFDTRANADSETNQTVIGYQAIGLGSNTTVIGNSSTTFGRWWGNLLLGTSTNSGFLLDVNGTARVTGNLTTNLTATRIPFIGTGGVLSDDAGLTWDNTNKFLTLTRTSAGASANTLLLVNNSSNASTEVGIRFAPTSNFTIRYAEINAINEGDNKIGLSFVTAEGALITQKWRISPSGILQSNGAQTIQTSTGNLTLSTGGGNGNIALLPNGTGGVGVGTSSPNAVAQLEVSSTTKGFLPPRMTTAQRDLIAAVAGLVIYNTTTNKHQGHNGTAWQDFY